MESIQRAASYSFNCSSRLCAKRSDVSTVDDSSVSKIYLCPLVVPRLNNAKGGVKDNVKYATAKSSLSPKPSHNS